MSGVVIIDNFDSFVYNLYQYVGELGAKVQVIRNTASLKEIKKLNPERIIISPGPGRPEDSGVSTDIVREYTGKTPILGVCLGHQVIGDVFGAKVDRSKTLLHGKISTIKHDESGIFKGVENPLSATRYHSLAIEDEDFPEELTITARCVEDGVIQAIAHRDHQIFGVQFHPESILTPSGKQIIKNFLEV